MVKPNATLAIGLHGFVSQIFSDLKTMKSEKENRTNIQITSTKAAASSMVLTSQSFISSLPPPSLLPRRTPHRSATAGRAQTRARALRNHAPDAQPGMAAAPLLSDGISTTRCEARPYAVQQDGAKVVPR